MPHLESLAWYDIRTGLRRREDLLDTVLQGKRRCVGRGIIPFFWVLREATHIEILL